jgi:hypothetical protein
MARTFIGVTAADALALAAAACGGDDGGGDPLAREEYLASVQSLVAEYKTAQDNAFAILIEADDLGELKDAFAQLPESLDTFVSGLEGLEPPDEAATEHDEAVEAGNAFLERLQEVNDEALDAESVDVFVATAGNDELLELSDNFNATCPPLQDIADANNIDIDIGCPQ